MSAPRHSLNEETAPYARFTPPPAPPKALTVDRRPRKWPWIVGGLVLLIVLGSILPTGASRHVTSPNTVPSVAPVIRTEPPIVGPELVTLPTVKGRNGKIVEQDLKRRGLTNVSLASSDPTHSIVLLPENWTATSIEPPAGTQVSTDEPVVVMMRKPKGG